MKDIIIGFTYGNEVVEDIIYCRRHAANYGDYTSRVKRRGEMSRMESKHSREPISILMIT